MSALACYLLGCAPAGSPVEAAPASASGGHAVSPEGSPDSQLAITPETLRARGVPEALLRRLARSPFAYFRTRAEAFELRTCEAFRDRSRELPKVVVHGDPHLQQFVTTASAYGLEDFDRSGFGPFVVDLVRYAASLHVACPDAGFACDAPAAVAAFLNAYRNALVGPPPPRVPQVVQRLRNRAPTAGGPWLKWVASLMEPLEPAADKLVRGRFARFDALMHAVHADLPPDALQIKAFGSLSLGIGSVLERKLLFRVEGPTAAPDDDMVIEAREGRGAAAHSCVWRPSSGQPMVLVFNAILGRRLPKLHGVVPMFESRRSFWVQNWDPGYVELDIEDIATQAELEELAVDAGHQLGGHLWRAYPEGLLPYQLYAQREAFDATRARVRSLAQALAQETLRAWRNYRASLEQAAMGRPRDARQRPTPRRGRPQPPYPLPGDGGHGVAHRGTAASRE